MPYIRLSIPICGEYTGNELKLNLLILLSTGHTGDLGDTQLQSGGPKRSSRLDGPRDLVLERLSRLNLLGDPRGLSAVPVPARWAFPCAGFSLRSASTAGASLSWAPAVLGLFHTEIFSQVISESRHYRCHGSVCSLALCLITTKIWSNGH